MIFCQGLMKKYSTYVNSTIQGKFEFSQGESIELFLVVREFVSFRYLRDTTIRILPY